MRVLDEQDVANRRRVQRTPGRSRARARDRARDRSRNRAQARRVPKSVGLFARLRTALLSLLTLALAVSLAFLVPELEAEAERAVVANGSDAMLEASAPSLPGLRSGLVEFERTDDVEYMVGEGETLSEIARRYRIDYETLARFNDLRNPHTIAVGQVIVIPGTTRLLGAEE